MKFAKISDNQYINLDHVSFVKFDPDDGDCVAYFGDSDAKMYFDKDVAGNLKKVLDDRVLTTTEELYKRFGIPWPNNNGDGVDAKSPPQNEPSESNSK